MSPATENQETLKYNYRNYKCPQVRGIVDSEAAEQLCVYMSECMTAVFDVEAVYIALKVAAALRGRHAKDIATEAVRE